MMLLDSLKNMLFSAGAGKARVSAQVASGDFVALMDQAVDQPVNAFATTGDAVPVEGTCKRAEDAIVQPRAFSQAVPGLLPDRLDLGAHAGSGQVSPHRNMPLSNLEREAEAFGTDPVAQSDPISRPSLQITDVGLAAPSPDGFEPIATEVQSGASGFLAPEAVEARPAPGLSPIRANVLATPAFPDSDLAPAPQREPVTSDAGDEATSANDAADNPVGMLPQIAPPSAPLIASGNSTQPATVAPAAPVPADRPSSSIVTDLPSQRPATVTSQGKTDPHVQGESSSASEPLSPASPISPEASVPSNVPASRHVNGMTTLPPVPQDGAGLAPARPSPELMASVGEASIQPAILPRRQTAVATPVDPDGNAALSVRAKAKSTPPDFEALSLLQWARDIAPERSAATAVAKAEIAVRPADPSVSTSFTDQVALPATLVVTAPPTAASLATPIPLTIAPTVDVAATIGATIADMSVGGQWIDRLARDIAGVLANGPKGSFQVDVGTLGPIEIAISRNSDGAVISLRVASDAAEAALRQDGDRLRQDAALSAVRIADLRIERAPPADAPRGDAMGRDGGQHQGQADQQGAMGQGAGQSAGRQRHDNSSFTPKATADRAVFDEGQARDRTGDAPRARYA